MPFQKPQSGNPVTQETSDRDVNDIRLHLKDPNSDAIFLINSGASVLPVDDHSRIEPLPLRFTAVNSTEI